MMAWVVMVVAALVFWAALGLVLPRPPSGLRRQLTRDLTRLVDRVLGRRGPPPDPFDALRLQSRLGALAEEIRDLESGPRVYAKVHRLVAVNAAYDDLLDEACRLAGVPESPGSERGEALRWHEERALAERGWSW